MNTRKLSTYKKKEKKKNHEIMEKDWSFGFSSIGPPLKA